MPEPAVMLPAAQPCHLLTFDVEHWYEGFRYRGLANWQSYPPRDHRTMERVLDLLAETGQRATLFVTGRYAGEFPQIVVRAAREGHEIASHSHDHVVFPRLGGIDKFRDDLERSLELLGKLSGTIIHGYRAPKWSIPEASRPAALAVMAGLGLEYDSSVFPQWLSESRPVFPHRVKTETGATIWEIPATTYPFLASRVPVAGGVYFRFFPAGVTHAAFAACERRGRPAMIYLHPYDVDADCPRPPGGNPLFQWFRYWGVATTFDRLRGMLGRYRFSPIIDYLHDAEKQSSPAARP